MASTLEVGVEAGIGGAEAMSRSLDGD